MLFIVDLYDYTFKGCTSCFACKLKNAKTDGVCDEKEKRAYRDSHFEQDLKNAYDLGCRIAERAKSI